MQCECSCKSDGGQKIANDVWRGFQRGGVHVRVNVEASRSLSATVGILIEF